MTAKNPFYKGTTYPRRPWTKEELRKLIELWHVKTPEEIEAILNRPAKSFQLIATIMRKNGVQLEKKWSKPGERGISLLIKEVVEGK